jgi:hypothetical protein
MTPVRYAASPTPTSAILLTVFGGLEIASCYFLLAGLPTLIIGIVALNKNNHDPADSARLAKTGWIVFGVLNALHIIGYIGFFSWALAISS